MIDKKEAQPTKKRMINIVETLVSLGLIPLWFVKFFFSRRDQAYVDFVS